MVPSRRPPLMLLQVLPMRLALLPLPEPPSAISMAFLSKMEPSFRACWLAVVMYG